MNPITLESDSAPVVAAMGGGRPKRILVVDDDPGICAQVVSLLQQNGNEVETAVDGEAAWAALLSTPFDLLVTDHFMPKVSGLALARRIRVAHLPVLVVLTSEKLETSDTVNLSHDPWSRVDGFIHKPFTDSDLVGGVLSLLSDRPHPPIPSSSLRSDPNESCRPTVRSAHGRLQSFPASDLSAVG